MSQPHAHARLLALLKKTVSGPPKIPASFIRPDDTGTTVFVALKLVSEANGREHHMVKHSRKKSQQRSVHAALWAFRPSLPVPATVTLTRVGGKKMDKDNNASSFKHVQDAFAHHFGFDDGDESVVTWDYKQENGGPPLGVRIRIEERK